MQHTGMNPASHLPLLLACRMPRRGRLPSVVRFPVGASILGVEVLVDLAGDADVGLLGSGKNGWFFEGLGEPTTQSNRWLQEDVYDSVSFMCSCKYL